MEAGEILVRKGLLTPQQLQLARRHQAEGKRLDQAAVGMGLVSEEEALRALGEELGIEYVDLAEVKIDPSILKSFPIKFIYRESLFPIREQNGQLVVAMPSLAWPTP